MLLGTSALIKEETDGTIEYLYAQPVTRTSIVGQKLLSIIGSYVSFVWITGVVSAILFAVLNPKGSNLMTVLINMKTILAGMFFTGLIFLCLGLFLSTVIKSAKQATPFGMGIVFLTYVIGMLGSAFSASLERVKVLKYLSPIDYSMPLNVVKHGFDTTSLVIGITVILLSTVAAFIIYQRKDLRS
jgi:ABC-2 type transport system permease protein